MNKIYFYSLIVGVLVMLALYLSLGKVIDINDRSIKRTLALFCAVIGILTTLWFNQNPNVLNKYISQIVEVGIAVLLTLLVFARKSIGKK